MMQCKFYHTSGCKHGSKCIFLHDKTPAQMDTKSAFSDCSEDHALDHFEELFNDNERLYNSGHHQLNKSFANIVKEKASCISYSGTSAVAENKEICRFFSSGNCKFGEKCRNLHAIVGNLPLLTQEEVAVKVECGICIESSSSPLYGILNNCDCKFCLPCIREWRKDGLRVAKDPLHVRLCPLCRKESFYVIPSTRFVTGIEKQEALSAFRDSISSKPCKYEKLGGCPFGTSCFYKHELQEPKIRYVHKSEEDAQPLTDIKLWDFVKSRKIPF